MNQVEKIAAPAVGNAIAYFLVIWIATVGWLPLENQVEAIAMAGIIITWALLQLGAFLRWAAALIERLVNGRPPDP